LAAAQLLVMLSINSTVVALLVKWENSNNETVLKQAP